MQVDTPTPVVHARQSVHHLLSAHNISHIIPSHTRVVLLDSCLTVSQALHSLRENAVNHAIIVHAGSFTDVLSPNHALNCPLDAFLYSIHTPQHGQFLAVTADESLLNVSHILKQTNVVPVVEGNVVMHTITRPQILAFLLKMLPHSPALMALPLQQLPIITYNIRSITPLDTVQHAISVMQSLHISAVPVVENGTFVGVFGKQQLINTPQGIVTPAEGICLHSTQPLAQVFEALVRYDRVFVSDHGNVVGVVCLSDLLTYFLDTF